MNNSSLYSKSKIKYLSQYILYITISIFHYWKLILYTDLQTERLKVITEYDFSVNTNGPKMVHIRLV